MATAEITLGGLHAGETLEAEQLPIKLCGISHCFRTEAGAAGRASRGLYRVHQFTKVEMFAFTLPDQSDAMLDHFCDLECRLFDELAIPYRVVDTATGDLGGPAYRKFDLEAWMPGRGAERRVGRSHQHVQLHRLPGAATEYPLQTARPERNATGPHAQRNRHRDQPGVAGDPREFPAGRRIGRSIPRGAAPVGRLATRDYTQAVTRACRIDTDAAWELSGIAQCPSGPRGLSG